MSLGFISEGSRLYQDYTNQDISSGLEGLHAYGSLSNINDLYESSSFKSPEAFWFDDMIQESRKTRMTRQPRFKREASEEGDIKPLAKVKRDQLPSFMLLPYQLALEEYRKDKNIIKFVSIKQM